MIALMDCNNFFVSCERLFRPDLAKKPVAVLSSNDGCIVSRSQEVKDLGIPMGIPYFKVKDICEEDGITLFSSNFTLYRDISARVMEVLKEVAEGVQIYSIDEAFFTVADDVTEEELMSIKKLIFQKVGIPVSIGAAKTKTLAKYAGSLAKKGNGAYILTMEEWEKRTGEVAVSTIWGIGRKTAEKLRGFGILTVKDMLETQMSFIRSQFGVEGERLRHELLGIPAERRTDPEDTSHKSIMSTRSFEKTIRDLGALESAVGYHVLEIAKKLRKEKCLASKLYVSIRPSRHSDYAGLGGGREIDLLIPTSDTQVLLKEALAAVRVIYDREIPYKKAGVVAAGIIPERFQTDSLFDTQISKNDGVIDSVTDALNAKFGHNMIRPAVVMHEERFAAKHSLKSKQYTTSWTEIVSVKAV